MYYYIEKYLREHFAGFDIEAKENFMKWAKKKQITRYSDDPCWIKLSTSFDKMKIFYVNNLPPSHDHPEMYADGNGKRYYVFHPYHDNRSFDKEMLWGWTYGKGLSVEIISPVFSWYAPGESYTVVISVDDMDYFKKYIAENRWKDKKGGGWIVG